MVTIQKGHPIRDDGRVVDQNVALLRMKPRSVERRSFSGSWGEEYVAERGTDWVSLVLFGRRAEASVWRKLRGTMHKGKAYWFPFPTIATCPSADMNLTCEEKQDEKNDSAWFLPNAGPKCGGNGTNVTIPSFVHSIQRSILIFPYCNETRTKSATGKWGGKVEFAPVYQKTCKFALLSTLLNSE